ncbi:MAG: glycosyltransferase [Alphaproteobacteria bacterium]
MTEKTNIYISVIVPTYRNWADLLGMLQAMLAQDYPLHCFEVLVANNDPKQAIPDSINAVAQTNDLQLSIIDAPRPGSYAARNTAAMSAKGCILAFTDSDCRPASNWLTRIRQTFDQSAVASDLISGRVQMYSMHGNDQTLNFAESYDYVFGINQDIYANWHVAATANLSVRKTLFFKLNGFDETLMSGGDGDFCMRAGSLGHQVEYHDSIIVNHPLRDNVNEVIAKARRVIGGRAKRDGLVVMLQVLIPPIVRLKILVRKPHTSAAVKLRALVLLTVIKLAEIEEVFRIFLLGKSPARH